MKNKDFTLHLAEFTELSACVQVLAEGRKYQQSQGFTQWPEGYPSEEDVRQDIAAGKGYVLKSGGRICAYFYIDFYDRAYPDIIGAWHCEEPYMVIHRVAIQDGFRGTGVSGILFSCFEDLAKSKGIYNLRIDTHEKNVPMQRVLSKNGYRYCGTVVQNNGLRLAYDKRLTR